MKRTKLSLRKLPDYTKGEEIMNMVTHIVGGGLGVISMICYIGMGWAVLPFMAQTRQLLGTWGFGFLLVGGIAYTVGAILYGIGAKKRWFYSVFHIFVVLGSLLQMIYVVGYVI